MILNKILQKHSKFFPIQKNQKKVLILKKNFSDLCLPIKNKKNIFSTPRPLSIKNLKKRSTLLQTKINFIWKNPIKTSREMESKFYFRNREAFKNVGKSNKLYSGVIKDSDKIVNKIILDYKDIQGYDKEVLTNNRFNYKRNMEYLENHEIIRENKRIKENYKFNKLKNAENPKSISYSNHKITDSFGSSLFSTPKYKTLVRKVSLNHENVKVKENKLEEKVNNLLLHKKYLYYKRLKENAKKFCDRVRNLDFDCESYEEIDNSNSKISLGKQNLINVGNLERIIKLKCIKDGGYSSEDYEGNIEFLRKSIDEYNLFCDKITSGNFPNFVKKEKFFNRTMIKYANLKGKFFGVPV